MERPRRQNTAKAKQQAALERLRAAREGRESRCEQYESDDEGDVWEDVTEEEYKNIVQARQESDDFVVDDNGLGYADNGEELFDRTEDDEDGEGGRAGKKSGGGGGAIAGVGEETLRKARKLNRMGEGAQGGSIRRFLQATGTAVGPSAISVPAPAAASNFAALAANIDIDHMLQDLSSNPLGAAAAASAKRRRVSGGGGGAATTASKRPVPANAFATPSPFVNRRSSASGARHNWNVRDMIDEETKNNAAAAAAAAAASGMVTDGAFSATNNDYEAPELPAMDVEDGTDAQGPLLSGGRDDEGAAAAAAAPKKPSRFARLKMQNGVRASAATEAALNAGAAAAAVGALGAQNLVAGGAAAAAAYMPSLSFDGPQYALGGNNNAAAQPPATPAAAAAGASAWLKKDEQGEYLRMYWIDATEVDGVLYLIGKVEVGENSGTFSSACVVVRGSARSLLVLPRLLDGDEVDEKGRPARAGVMDVHQEISKLLVPGVIPRTHEGEKFRAKPVQRKYAFQHAEVPREETQYLKVKYSMRYPPPPLSACEEGGRTFQRIFGARTTAVENFLLKRKLMGPCWLTIRNPEIPSQPVSWCRIEVAVNDPKQVSLVPPPYPPPPPIVALSLNIKTVVHPNTHASEIVAMAAVVHREAKLDGPTDDASPGKMMAWLAVRPLGSSASEGFPKVFPHDLEAEVKRHNASNAGVAVKLMPNERALLSCFFALLQQEDPDVVAGHNFLGFDFAVLLSRAVANKLGTWSKIGRLRRNRPPRAFGDAGRETYSTAVTAGRIICDTYKASQEFLRSETTYSLSHLAARQLNAQRADVDPSDIPKLFGAGAQQIVQLTQLTAFDASLVQRLMLKLQVIPLTKTLTNITGNLWSNTARGMRADRIDHLLLHKFHELKYVTPEKRGFKEKETENKNASAAAKKKGKGGKGGKGKSPKDKDKSGGAAAGGEGAENGAGKEEDNRDDAEDGGNAMGNNGGGGGGGGSGKARRKPAYAGGLVLEPKKGLYDSFILLLDFASLYPSLIQEYNLCFTTMDWSKYVDGSASEDRPNAGGDIDEEALAAAAEAAAASGGLLPLPPDGLEQGVLPCVIKSLVMRRREVKKLLAAADPKDVQVREQLDIRQKALKLTANSMYGCLGFSGSRFCAKPIAALVTFKGRETLQRTVDIAQLQLGLDVIYGDTDSIMIATNSTDLAAVKAIGNNVRKEVNKLYRSLELELDGVFKAMLLLKKKKYAALVVKEKADGSLTYEQELKGLDLVRRDWCPLSRECGRYVVGRILSGENRDAVVAAIHEHVTALAAAVRNGEVPLDQYVITRGLNRAPEEYGNAAAEPHVQVAIAMRRAGKPVSVGNHIPYVTCEPVAANSPSDGANGNTPPSQSSSGGKHNIAERARHPEDVLRSGGALKLDVEWYLGLQVLPPLVRLCEPIEGTSRAALAECMGLDPSRYAGHGNSGNGYDDEAGASEQWAFTPSTKLSDEVRFRDCSPLSARCLACRGTFPFRGVFCHDEKRGVRSPADLQPGLSCPSLTCGAAYWGAGNPAGCFSSLYQALILSVRRHQRRHAEGWLVCDDSSCGRRTRQLGVNGALCGAPGCQGRVRPEVSDKALYEQLKFFETLFDVRRARERLAETFELDARTLPVDAEHAHVFSLLLAAARGVVESSGYNWIRPSLWSVVFPAGRNSLGGGAAAAAAAAGSPSSAH